MPGLLVARLFRITTRPMSRLRTTGRFGGEVALPRAGAHVGPRHAHGEIVHLAVEPFGCEAERVLVMKLVGDARERQRKISGRCQLERPATGGGGDLR